MTSTPDADLWDQEDRRVSAALKRLTEAARGLAPRPPAPFDGTSPPADAPLPAGSVAGFLGDIAWE